MGVEEKTNEMVVVDIGKYKKIKRALKESEERYRLLFENVPLGVYRTTPDGKVLDANPAYIKMMGYESFEEISSVNLNVECQNLKYPRDKFKAFIEQQGELKGFEVNCTKKDGSPITLRENAIPFRDENGKILYYEGTIEDITEQKRVEELCQKRSQQLEILNNIILSGNKATKVQQLLEIIIDCVLELLNFKVACIYLIDEDRKTSSLRVSRGLSSDMLKAIQTCPVDIPPYLDIYSHGKSIYANEYFYNLMGKKFSRSRGWLGMAAVPLFGGDRVIGSLHVASHEQHEFQAEDRAILEIIGKESGILISKLLTESALRESEKFYRQLIETSPDLIGLISPDNEIQMVNRQFLLTCGYSDEKDVLGKRFTDFLLPVEIGRYEENKKALLHVGKVSNLEFDLKDREKGSVPFEMSASLVRDAEGDARGFIFFGRDISARKLSEKDLKENEQIFRRTFEAIPDPAYVWLRQSDGSTVLHLANNAARQVSQNRIQDYLSLKLEEIYIDHPEIVSRVKEVFASGRSINEVIRFKERASEDEKWLLVDYVKTSENNILWITKDITERKLSEEKVLQYQEQLRSLTSALALAEERERRKIAVSLHDHIGQQLAFSKIKLETLEKSVTDSATKKSIDEIRRMMDQTMEDTRSLIFELSPPVLYELGFDSAVEWLVENIQKRFNLGIDFIMEGKLGHVEEDTQIMLFQIMRELLMNIAKHSQARTAKIKISREKSGIQIEVKDDGRGFNADEFFSAKDVSGFGFFSIRERIKHLGGILKVESKEKGGTRVLLKVPLVYN